MISSFILGFNSKFIQYCINILSLSTVTTHRVTHLGLHQPVPAFTCSLRCPPPWHAVALVQKSTHDLIYCARTRMHVRDIDFSAGGDDRESPKKRPIQRQYILLLRIARTFQSPTNTFWSHFLSVLGTNHMLRSGAQSLVCTS